MAIVQAVPVGAAEADKICRFCHAEEYPEPGGELIAPCQCKGTQRYVHLYCLQVWQTHNKKMGAHRKARYCDVCSAEYVIVAERDDVVIEVETKRIPPQLLRAPSLLRILFQLWQTYALCNSTVSAIRLGLQGLKTGGTLGVGPAVGVLKIVVKSTSSIRPPLVRMFVWGVILRSSTAFYLPLKHFCSNICYLSILLGAAGSAYGLCTSYIKTIKWTAQGTSALAVKAVGIALFSVFKVARRCAGLLRRSACVLLFR